MSLLRFQIIYPNCMFRAVINSKNIAPPEDKWAEGALCCDDRGLFYILNRKAGNNSEISKYSCCYIDLDTLGLYSGLSDGSKHNIFEGDILKITCFRPIEECEKEPEETDSEDEDIEDPFAINDLFVPESFEKEDGSCDSEERTVYDEVPENCEELFTLEGVVFMYSDAFYIQFFDENMGMLNALPLYIYFSLDGLPYENTAVKVTGNIYDNEELYKRILRLNTGIYSSGMSGSGM